MTRQSINPQTVFLFALFRLGKRFSRATVQSSPVTLQSKQFNRDNHTQAGAVPPKKFDAIEITQMRLFTVLYEKTLEIQLIPSKVERFHRNTSAHGTPDGPAA